MNISIHLCQYIYRVSRLYHTGIEDGQQFKIKIHPATSSVYSPHATRKGTQSFTIHCLDKVTDEVSIYNPLLKLQLAWHYFCATLQWCAILFLKYQGWGFSAPNVRMANIINSIWFLNGLSILKEVSFYKKNPQNIEMKLLYS